MLQALGVIEIRHGFGMFVAPEQFRCAGGRADFPRPAVPAAPGQEALQLVDVRQALESGLIGSAMDEMTAEQLAAVEEAVIRMEALAAAGEPFVEADAEFHRRLFEPLNNELLFSLLGVFWKVYRKIHLEVGGRAPRTCPGSAAAAPGDLRGRGSRRTRPWPPSGSTTTSTASASGSSRPSARLQRPRM